MADDRIRGTALPDRDLSTAGAIDAWRREFPVLARRTYLNSGSYGALAQSVKASVEDYLETRLTRGADWPLWMEKNEHVRAALARLLSVTPGEIAVTASASAGINALASALEFSNARRKVVISDFEFPTSGQIWHAQERRGIDIVHVPETPDGDIPLAHFARLIDERTALVAVSHVCYRNGARLDVAGIARIAHERGALVLLDCYQSVGAEVVDLRALDVDFAVGGMLKYLLGTAGIGFLYVRDTLIPDLVPLATGWLAQADIAAMDITRNEPAPDARRFESGTPAVVGCYAAEAGLQIVQHVGAEAIGARIAMLTGRCLQRLAEHGISVATPRAPARRGPTVAIRARDDEQLVARLMAHDVVTSCRDGNVRASFHFYNDEADIDRLIEALLASRALLC